MLGRDDLGKVHAGRLGRRVAGDPLGRPVDRREVARQVVRVDQVVGVFEEPAIALLALAQRPVGARAVGDVAEDALHDGPSAELRDRGADLDRHELPVRAAEMQVAVGRMAGADLLREEAPVRVLLALGVEIGLARAEDAAHRDAEQLLGLTVRVEDDAGLEAGHDDGVVGGVEEVAVARLPGANVPQHHPGEQHAAAQQERGDQHRDLEQQPLDVPCPLGERAREGVLERRHALVEPADLAEERADALRIRPAGGDLGAERLAPLGDRGDVAVAGGPDGDRLRHVAHVAEPPEEHRQAADVVRMIASPDESLPDHAEIRPGLPELEPRLLVAERHGHGGEIPAVVALVSRVGVARKMVDGVLLALRPQALAAHVGPHRRQDLHLRVGEHEQAGDDEDEEDDDEAELLADGEEAQGGPDGGEMDRPLHARTLHQRA